MSKDTVRAHNVPRLYPVCTCPFDFIVRILSESCSICACTLLIEDNIDHHCD